MHKRKPKILVIEDEKSLLNAWVESFKKQGFDVLAAADGATALEKAGIEHPDMVVVDLSISDGLMTIKKLREYKWGNGVPVTFLNSWQDPETFGRQANNDYWAYDWKLEQVVQTVKNRLDSAKQPVV